MLDLAYVRSHFPALSGDWIFMDNAGGSQTLKTVSDRISDYLLTSDVQHGASYEVSQIATQRVRQANQAMATFINATYAEEVVMGASATMVFRLLSLCLAKTLEAGDEIIVSNADHEANVSPWTDLADQGIVIKIWKVRPETMEFHLEDLGTLMTDRTRLVCVTHTSNVLGTLNPVKEYARFVHDRGALIAVDGVAHAPHRLIDVQETDVDFYVFSTYKVYGPHYALLYGKKEHLLRLPGINHYFIQQDDLPYKFQPGNNNFELTYSMLGVVDYLEAVAQHHQPDASRSSRANMELAFELFVEHEERLAARFLDFLNSQASVRVVGSTDSSKSVRVPTISFVVDGMQSDHLVEQVDPHKIGIRFGDFYAKKLIEDLDLESYNGVVRVSLVHYNTLEEVDRLIGVLEKIL
ncbi:MAG: cysteine desulfurase-like protein [Bacteroidota bacterium]